MKIRNWETNEIIIQRNVDTIKDLVEIAVKENISLEDAFLENADLQVSNSRKFIINKFIF